MALASVVGQDPCQLADRWSLSESLARKLVHLESQARSEFGKWWPGLFVISGYRDPVKNAEVGGVPNSFHTYCPSLAADLRVGNMAGFGSDEIWAILGGMWRLSGGRWGGTFSNPDPNHFDIGGVG